jgi:hypothetical protein
VYLKSISSSEVEVRLATKTTLGQWNINIVDTLGDYNISLMGKQPLDIDLKDDLFVVCSSTKKICFRYGF